VVAAESKFRVISAANRLYYNSTSSAGLEKMMRCEGLS
jgi:hypothetical protein